MRKCKHCNQEKVLEEFPIAVIIAEKIYRRYLCAKCYYLVNTSQNTKRVRQWFEDYKKTLKCGMCPENDFRVLDFHHRDRGLKLFHVSEAVSKGWGKETILSEVAKCDVLCANCHRKVTYNERKGD